MRKLSPVGVLLYSQKAGKMRWRLWILLLASLLAKTKSHLISHLEKALLERLSLPSSQFDEWIKQMSENLSSEQQHMLARNVRFLETPKSTLQLSQLQQQLSPVNSVNNPMKLWLWISLYWQLKRSNRLHNDNMLLPHFALTLRQLQTDKLWNNNQLQNMVQSLPRYLSNLVRSRWLCLKHDRDQLYALPGGVLQLGVNSNCSLWQARIVKPAQYWVRLENACEVQATWFINMLQYPASETYMLLNATSDNSSTYCIKNGAGYLVEVNIASENHQTKRTLGKDCHWQLNDCTQVPEFLKGHTLV